MIKYRAIKTNYKALEKLWEDNWQLICINEGKMIFSKKVTGKKDTKDTTGINGIKKDTKDTYNKSKSDSDSKKDNKSKSISIKESKEIIATKVATLKDYMLSDIDKEHFINNYNIDELVIKKEMMDFYLYWSEKKPNWKKELWQMQKTFDVNRRFHKWLENKNKWESKEKTKISNITF